MRGEIYLSLSRVNPPIPRDPRALIIPAMAGQHFEFRQCINPECGLRYPLVERNAFGERCPACLGETVTVAQGRLEREENHREKPGGNGPSALIDNVRSAWNVGSMFRSAEGFGICHLYLCGITATPENAHVGKTALGAENIVAWSAHKNAVQLVSRLKDEGRSIWALERTAGSVPLRSVLSSAELEKVVLVVGNEQAGIDPGIIDLADRVVHIEMQGRKRSFNVAVAFAVAAALLSDKR